MESPVHSQRRHVTNYSTPLLIWQSVLPLNKPLCTWKGHQQVGERGGGDKTPALRHRSMQFSNLLCHRTQRDLSPLFQQRGAGRRYRIPTCYKGDAFQWLKLFQYVLIKTLNLLVPPIQYIPTHTETHTHRHTHTHTKAATCPGHPSTSYFNLPSQVPANILHPSLLQFTFNLSPHNSELFSLISSLICVLKPLLLPYPNGVPLQTGIPLLFPN